MIKALSVQNIYSIGKNNSVSAPKPSEGRAYALMTELPNYPISFCSTQIERHSKGSTPYVALKLKALDGTLDEKLPKAKDIILKDMGLPCDLVECIDKDLGGKGYAAYSAPLGIVAFDKKFCQKPDSEFSDEAIICILRHELDHMEVFTKLYKKIGGEEFEKLLPVLYGKGPEGMPEVNHKFYKEMSKHVNIDNFDADKFIYAIKNYYDGTLGDSHYKNFILITKNFDNALEDSAREKQYELESLMGVRTLKDFYSMIEETKKLVSKIKATGVNDEEKINQIFDTLYTKAQEETGLEDKTHNWGKILSYAETLL